jgi:hypothetical protein
VLCDPRTLNAKQQTYAIALNAICDDPEAQVVLVPPASQLDAASSALGMSYHWRINHSDNPNCELDMGQDGVHRLRLLRNITAFEELSFRYCNASKVRAWSHTVHAPNAHRRSQISRHRVE